MVMIEQIKTKKPATVFSLTDSKQIIARLLEKIGADDPASPSSRSLFLQLLKDELEKARQSTEIDLLANRRGVRCAQNLSLTEDEIIRSILTFAVDYVFLSDRQKSGQQKTHDICIAAVGGYGRGTLAPGSDIDLLFILPSQPCEHCQAIIEYVLYMLWDLGQKVGHAVRTMNECLLMAKTDMTVRTATLESRFLVGNLSLFQTLVERFKVEIIAGTGPQFIDAKLAERDVRHEAYGNTRYVVEPNIKDGKGGLRDLNTLFWIGKYFYSVNSNAELVEKGVFTRSELRVFEKAEDFLWSVRCHLHFLTGRAEEKLHFDVQPEMARRLDFADRAGMLSVERFMKRYFLVAKDVGDLTRLFCASLEFAHAKKPDLLGRFLSNWHKGTRKIEGEKDFVVERGRINVSNDKVFADNPINLIRIFWLAAREDILFHPEALKQISRSLGLITTSLRNDKKANKLFLEILTNHKSAERILRRMNESGVLGKFVPEFGKIVALMQFNMYHHYTVDEHLIRSIGVMAGIASGEYKEELPLTHELLPTLSDTKLLFVALFLHDIAKGRKEDHSIVGEKIARKLCPRFGLTPPEIETVAWLIRYHLIMSEISQSRDIQDPETAHSFAQLVQSPNRLALLMILTACDIRAVGPGVWTGWKGSLLRSLYYATEPLLSGGHSKVNHKERLVEVKSALIEALLALDTGWTKTGIKAYIDRHYSPYWLRTDPSLQIEHAKMVARADKNNQSFCGNCSVRSFEGITEVSFYTADHPRLLSFIAAACTLSQASIVGAHISSMRDGYALDTLRLRRSFNSDEDEKIRAVRVIDTVKQLLDGTKQIPANLGADSRLNKRLKPFKLPPDIQISNGLSQKFTVIEVSGLDRAGLLYDLTRQLADLNLTIGSAHIGTYGEKAVDVFYVTDLTGAKISDPARQKKIKRSLLSVLAPVSAIKAVKA
ncbi:[Protein-PII] uridylyltransferase / [Protein-PII]-UMP uridylyl-removing enzyme [hydrothermal vent metagenome]|uniref:[Protein-PII] uridylyltransferase / [Protein-PII]-UMP uridylyl-removing enzyme n=1 Tax=hydrothermal vent metagenome TaxID=652676 RepID=A0A3B0U0L1_9ZZZZ